MEMFTLTEASAKLKESKIKADARKLIREAIAGKLWLSIGVHGYFYSPTLKVECESVVGKYLNDLLGIKKNEYESSPTQIRFEAELTREVFNSSKWQKLNESEKISFLISGDIIETMYERYSNPSIGGCLLVYPRQLLNPLNGIFKIEAGTDGKNFYCINESVTLDDLLIDECHLNKYIETLTCKPLKPARLNRLYAEITDTFPDFQNMSPYELLNQLKQFAGKNGSCIKSVSNNSVKWLTNANMEIETKLPALQKWLERQKIDIKDTKDSMKR